MVKSGKTAGDRGRRGIMAGPECQGGKGWQRWRLDFSAPGGWARPWRRTCSRPDTACGRGTSRTSRWMSSNAAAGVRGDALISMLPNDAALREVFIASDLLRHGRAAIVSVNMGTVSLD